MDNWKENYDKAILDKNYKIAVELKDSHLPDSLYKYRAFDINGYWKDWVCGIITYSSPLTFNDPYDCLLSCSDDAFNTLYPKMIIDSLKTGKIKISTADKNRIKYSDTPLETAQKILANYNLHFVLEKFRKDFAPYAAQKNLLVACFSQINNSLLMWSHYAINHSGFCIEYDISKLPSVYNLFPVVYDDRRETITKEIVDNENFVFNPIVLKCTVWNYEQEWRLIIPEKNHDKNTVKKHDVKDTIKAIYLGAKISEENEKQIRAIVPENVAIKKMRMRDNSYELYVKLESYTKH